MRDELHADVVTAVHEAVLELDLVELPSARVYLRQLVTDRDVELPCVIVTPMGVEENPEGTFEDEDFGWPVTVWFLSASNQDLQLKRLELSWRKQVLSHFGDNPLRPVKEAEAYDVRLEPGPVVDLELWHSMNLLGGYVTLRVHTRQARERT